VSTETRPSAAAPVSWAPVILAWILVGVPILWGVWNTLLKAAALFR
jgi:hypothetical protein